MSSRAIYRGKVLDLFLDDVTLPNGRRTQLEIVRHPGAAAVVPFVSPREVLLIRQYRYAAGGRILEVPAGKLDAGEDPKRCAARELEEETGWRAGRIEPLGAIWTTPGFCDERIHLFAAFDLEETAHDRGPDELIEVVRTPLPQALDRIWDGGIEDSKSVAALLHAARRLGAL